MQNAVAELELELAPGERLVWSGRPQQGLRFLGIDAFLIPFGFAWLAFAIAFEWMILTMPAPNAGAMRTVFFIFGLPFVAMGLYLAVGRLWIDARQRRQTAYGLTNRRALIVIRGRSRRVRAVELREIRDVHVAERSDGSGTLRLISTGTDTAMVSSPTTHVFKFLPRVREAYEALQQLRDGLMTGATGSSS